ncbi:MAG: anion permease [Saprospiraceae bacterium]|nr:anion permease [Saprospiraceae bacterium]
MKNIWVRRAIVLLVGISIWLVPVPWDLSRESWQLFTIFFTSIMAIIFNVLPIFLSALTALILSVLTNTLPVEKAFSGFSESFMMLILAAFLVSKAVIKSGLGHRIALLLIRKFGRSTLRLAYCIAATDVLIGPAIPSNTARSGILYPIINALGLDTDSRPDDDTRKRTGSYLMMCGIASLTVSSALWLTAMAANPIGAEIASSYGVEINFLNWLLAGSLPCTIAFVTLPYLLYRIFPPELRYTPEAPQRAREGLVQMGPLSRKEWITAGVFVGMVALWALAGRLHLNLAIVALMGLAVLMITGVYRLENLRKEGGDALETFIWFSILYVMSSALNEMGFMSTLGTQISGLLSDLNWTWTYLFLTLLYVVIHYLFVSQTAHLLALYAVFLAVGIQTGVPALLMAFMLSFATNYFSAITPQASSGNVLFVSSGYLEPRDVYRNGAIITLINMIIFLLATPWILWVSKLTLS